MLQLIGNAEDITSAINDFRPSFHQDFTNVHMSARRYLKTEPTSDYATLLAQTLSTALRNWGACKRRGPTLRPIPQIENTLRDRKLHASLSSLIQQNLSVFGLNPEGHRIFNPGASFSDTRNFDNELLSTLTTLANRLFINNTSVTYPMKALLLLTGLMPALDSQVRRGLKRAGKMGFAGQQLLPSKIYQAGGRRICDLPFYLGQCWEVSHQAFIEGIRGSCRPELEDAPGRVFDVLLFMQAQPTRTLTLSI